MHLAWLQKCRLAASGRAGGGTHCRAESAGESSPVVGLIEGVER